MSPEERIHLKRMDDERIARLEERVSNWMESTTEYRKSLCSKLDILLQNQTKISEEVHSKISSLPCSKGHDNHVDRQLGAIWWIVSVCMVGVVSVAVAWGAVSKQVEINTQRWDRYLEESAHAKVQS
jgi:hypothetical protein